jgi:hypothetical protein
MKTLRKHSWQMLIWAMVPVTLFAGIPKLGCICINGQYKLFCERHLSGCCRGESKPSAGKGLCPCCHKGQLADARKAADTDKPVAGCCHGPAKRVGGQAHSERCCKPVVGIPLLPPVVQHVAVPDLTLFALLAPSVDLLQGAVVSPTRESAWNPTLPVPDLLIAHQVFLI